MTTSRNIEGTGNDRTKVRAASRRVGAARVALAILAVAACAPRPGYASAPSAPPVSQCSDFGCEQ